MLANRIPGALGNMNLHSDELVKETLSQKVLPHLVATTCRERNVATRLATVLALRAIVKRPALKLVCNLDVWLCQCVCVSQSVSAKTRYK